jgi:tetratricopeptide (TPR) repeat protein
MNTTEAFRSAVQHVHNGDLLQAEQICREIPENQPGNVNANILMGDIFRDKSQPEEAIRFYKHAISIKPDFAGSYYNLGIVLQKTGQLDEAVVCYQKTIELDPAFSGSYYNMGTILHEKKTLNEALLCYERAIELNPHFFMAYFHAGEVLQQTGQYEKAILYFQAALRVNPGFAEGYRSLGYVYEQTGRIHEAISLYQKALEINPDLLGMMNLFLHAHFSAGTLKSAIPEYYKYWRKVCPDKYRDIVKPLWDGSVLNGDTILLHGSGFGDNFWFIRYVPLILKKGLRIIYESSNELFPLLRDFSGIEKVIVRGDPWPDFDVHCPMYFLPLVFNTTCVSIPSGVPYISAAPGLVRKWKNRMGDTISKLKIGIVWSSGPEFHRQSKSCSLELFASLGQHNIVFYSLQKGFGSEQANNPPPGIKLIDYTGELHDFSDTAALIENLDLVISVDTAVAHLAGAMGKPVWTLLQYAPYWWWTLEKESSPWYPTMRLFVQEKPGDWESVMAQVTTNLDQLLHST